MYGHLKGIYQAITTDTRPYLVAMDALFAMDIIIAGSIAATHLGWPTNYGALSDNVTFVLGMGGLFACISALGVYPAQLTRNWASTFLGVLAAILSIGGGAYTATLHHASTNFAMHASVWTALIALATWRFLAPLAVLTLMTRRRPAVEARVER